MAKTIDKFRTWLTNQRDFLFSRYTKDDSETQEPERSLIQLPPAQKKQLVSAVENLPSNPADKQAISSTLDEAFELWRDDPNNANNSVVILSSPVAAVSRILSETLAEWAKQKQVSLKLVPLKARPTEIESTISKLENYLNSESAEDKDPHQLEIIVIPNLSWCFLRSLEGLDAIEYIQSLLCDGSKNRFWIIGSGQVGWQYLHSVCSIEAYCGKVFSLPAIEPEEFQSWFEPIVQELDIVFEKPRIERQILDGEKDCQASYFDRLADISQGIATVAIQAFLKSIYYEDHETDDGETKKDEIKRESPGLIAQTPKLPNLPDLDSVDQYLLYSLLLHGDLTVAALAESLGDLESEVQARVQLLRREGVVEQKDKVIKINPIYYPKVKQELANNNFIINRNRQ